jgi:YkoY family integral membrane protein
MDFLGMVEIFGQQVEPHDVVVVLLLVLLEGVLSIDNALVLGILAKRLPKGQQKKALTYGLVGAFVFRFVAIFMAAYLMHWRVVKLIGGAYLVYISVKHFLFESGKEEAERVTVDAEREPVLVHAKDGTPLTEAETERDVDERLPGPLPHRKPAGAGGMAGFWPTVLVIELTDIAFAVDSILAAIALVGSPPAGHEKDAFHPKFWVIVTGGILGVILMRFAAVVFIKLLERFPRFEVSAYLLVLLIGVKLLVDWHFNSADVHDPRVDFHSYHSPAFWVFWVGMVVCFAVGFLPRKRTGREDVG